MNVRYVSMKVLGLLIAVTLMVALAPVKTWAHHDEGLLDQIRERGVVRLCMASFIPYAWIDLDTDEWLGYDPELGREFAKQLNVELEIVEVQFSTAIAALQAKKCDIAWLGLVRIAKRALVVDFADPYIGWGIYVGVHRDDNRFKSYDDLNKPEITIAARPDYSGEMAKKFFPNAKHLILQTTNYDAPRMEILAGRADATVDDGPSLGLFQKEHEWFKTLVDLGPKEPNEGAFAVRPGNERLLNFINAFIAHQKEGGLIPTLMAKYMVPPKVE